MPARPLRLDDFMPFRLAFTSNLVGEVVAGAYRSLFELTIPEWRILAVVAEHDGIAQAQIAGLTRMDKVTVSRASIALVGRKLVERGPHAVDRRSHLLRLTEQGRALHREIAPKALELEDRLFASFDKAELEQFAATLRAIDQAALAMLGEA
jgi:DNA-binding MarR family transcriptional regulator